MPVDLSLAPLRPKSRTKSVNCDSYRLLLLTLATPLPRDQGRAWPSMLDTRQDFSWQSWAWRISNLKRHTQSRRMWYDKDEADLREHTLSFCRDSSSSWLQDAPTH